MEFPIAIEPGDEKQAFGVVVPDLPGCFSAGDTIEEAIDNAKEAIELWLETAITERAERKITCGLAPRTVEIPVVSIGTTAKMLELMDVVDLTRVMWLPLRT